MIRQSSKITCKWISTKIHVEIYPHRRNSNKLKAQKENQFKQHINFHLNCKASFKQRSKTWNANTFRKPTIPTARDGEHRSHQCRSSCCVVRHHCFHATHFNRIPWYQNHPSHQFSILSIQISKLLAENYLKMGFERGLLPEMRNGERAALALEATLAAAFLTEEERNMDLAAKPALTVAIAVLNSEGRYWEFP